MPDEKTAPPPRPPYFRVTVQACDGVWTGSCSCEFDDFSQASKAIAISSALRGALGEEHVAEPLCRALEDLLTEDAYPKDAQRRDRLVEALRSFLGTEGDADAHA